MHDGVAPAEGAQSVDADQMHLDLSAWGRSSAQPHCSRRSLKHTHTHTHTHLLRPNWTPISSYRPPWRQRSQRYALQIQVGTDQLKIVEICSHLIATAAFVVRGWADRVCGGPREGPNTVTKSRWCTEKEDPFGGKKKKKDKEEEEEEEEEEEKKKK